SHYVADDAVLSRGIEPLQNNQDGPLVLGVELLLQLSKPLGAFAEQRIASILVEIEAAFVSGIDIGEAKLVAVFDAKALYDVGGKHGAATILEETHLIRSIGPDPEHPYVSAGVNGAVTSAA